MIKFHIDSIFSAMLILAISLLSSQITYAEDQNSIPVMPKVTVTGRQIDTLTSSQTIDRELIEELPSSNGNINELLKAVPGVQFSESIDNSKTGGEIRPLELSVSGGRTSENNYRFDGIPNNSSLDPDFTKDDNIDNIPGHSNSLFILDHLVEEVSVLSGNIPAKYGNFTGGVVEVKSIDPEDEFGGEIAFRFTRSDWGQFYIDPAIDPETETEEDKLEEIEEFKNSTSADNQPKFVKYQSSATLHVPVNDTVGFVFDYSRAESSIPLRLINEKKVQRRRDENIFLKSVISSNEMATLSLSALYAPYEGKYFKENTLNSDYSLFGGGYQFAAKLEKTLSFGQLETNLSYQESKNSRTAPADWYSWRATDSKPWGVDIDTVTSLEGGSGDLKKNQKRIASNVDIVFDSVDTGPVTHRLNLGGEINNTYATAERTETSTQFIATANSSVVCPAGATDCIDGEQFIYSRTFRPAYKTSAYIGTYSIYLEDNINLNRLDLRPGVRVSYDDFQENTNAAPRFATSFDIFGDGETIIKAGANRYYGADLLTQKLDEGRARTLYQRRSTALVGGMPKSWDTAEITTSSFRIGRVSDLETPYSDEITFGLQQTLFGGVLDVNYIDRDYRKQIVPVRLDKDEETDIIYREWRNSGERNYEEVTVSWEKSWPKNYIFIAATWEETKSNTFTYSFASKEFAEYEDEEKIDDIDRQALYRGQLYDKNELPTQDYNRPIKATFIYTVELPYHFSFTNRTNYRSRYRTVKDTGENIDADNDPDTGTSGKETDVYEDITKSSALTFDWTVSWSSEEWRGNSLEISLDILNVFNRRIPDGTKEDEYLLGRQYWAGVTYKF